MHIQAEERNLCHKILGFHCHCDNIIYTLFKKMSSGVSGGDKTCTVSFLNGLKNIPQKIVPEEFAQNLTFKLLEEDISIQDKKTRQALLLFFRCKES